MRETGVVGEDDVDQQAAFTVRCRWQVEGTVSHWGHAHTRLNEYVADWSVALTESGWRLTGAEILEQDRLEESSTDPLDDLEIGEDFEL